MAAETLMTGWLYRVGTSSARHRVRVLLLWLVAAMLLIGCAQNQGGKFSEEFGIPGTESYAAQELLEEPWITATTHHVATGTMLAFVSLTAVFTMIGGALRTLRRHGRGRGDARLQPPRSAGTRRTSGR